MICRNFDKWVLPDGEVHLIDWMKRTDKRVDGRLAYQYTKYEEALKYVKQRRVAIDIGAHVGLWSWYMARDFKDLAAFEPIKEHQNCWFENMKYRTNAELFCMALGNHKGLVDLHCRTQGSTGDTEIVPGNSGKIEIGLLDDANLPFVDFIKIDCEGYELNVLQGAEKTLLAWKPCIVVEQKGDMTTKYGHEKLAAVNYLKDLGAKVRQEISGDYIMSWDEAGTGRAGVELS
jgi:FkbM family methyltransferase